MSTLVASNLQASGGGGTAATLASINGGPISGARNRIINGDMRIDQRNGGASVNNGFAVDRFEFQENGAAAFTIQRSTIAPAGFVNSMVITVTTAGSATAAQVNRFLQRIEGNNIADLGFGAASASAVTLSFWVRSSLTGTYCAALKNNGANRAYVAEYSISSANTWEYKKITISGDITGTWETGTSTGIEIAFDLGSGSDYNATAGSWVASNSGRTTNQVNFANTNAATFYITGVQLEAGSVATPFERRSYGQELALCQRYYVKTGANRLAGGGGNTATVVANVPIPVTLRSTPSVSGSTTSVRRYDNNAAGNEASGTLSVSQLFDNNVQVNISGLTSVSDNMTYWVNVSLNFSAEL